MKPSLVILEGNCYLHAGEANWCKDFNACGFPTSGLYLLMSKICNLQLEEIPYAVVFDSPSFRKSIDSEYKKSRKVDHKILAQSNAIIPMLKRAGVNVLQVPEFEGDDLVANIIQANPDFRSVVYTCDYDLTINVSRNVSICGCKKGFPSINVNNFESIMERVEGRRIPYNTMGMYKAVFGCSSDEIKSIGPEAEKFWSVFMQILERDFTSKDRVLIVNRNYCEKFAKAVSNMFSPETIRRFNSNIMLVFPRMLTEKEILDNNISLTEFSNVSENDLIDIVRLFNMKKLYKMLTNSNEGCDINEREKSWLVKKARDYKMRADAVSAEIDINQKATFNDKSIEDEDEVSIQSDFNKAVSGLNIGLF